MNKENIPKRKSDNIDNDIDDRDESFHSKKLRSDLSKIDAEDIIYLNQTDENNNKISSNDLNLQLKPGQLISNHNEEDLDQLIVFQQLLNNLKKVSSDSIGGQAFQLPANPGLYVKNYGYVPLPLNKTIADELIYKINNNNSDEEISNFQVDSSLIEIKNKDWNQNLDSLMIKISEELGFCGKIEAKLNKLVIYDKDEHHKMNNADIKGTQNVIANLIIQLPSVYEGGESIISSGNDQKEVTFDFSKNSEKSQFYPHFLVHYTGDKHRILEIKDGIRLVLVYSLHSSHKDYYELNKNRYHVEKLSFCLKKISQNKENLLAILLDNKYYRHFKEGYGVEAFQKNDKDRFHLIKSANDSLKSQNQMNFHLVNASFTYKSLSPTENYKSNGNFKQKTQMELENQDWSKNVLNDSKISWFYENGGFVEFDAKLDVFKKIINPNSNNKAHPFIDFDNLDSLNIDKEVCYEKTDRGYVRITKYDCYFLALWPIKYQFEAFLKINKKRALWELVSIQNEDGFKPYPHFDQRFRHLIQLKDESIDENNILLFFDKYKDFELCKYYLNNLPEINKSLLSEFTRIFGCHKLKSYLDEKFLPITTSNFKILYVRTIFVKFYNINFILNFNFFINKGFSK
jgi:hypothetical protein